MYVGKLNVYDTWKNIRYHDQSHELTKLCTRYNDQSHEPTLKLRMATGRVFSGTRPATPLMGWDKNVLNGFGTGM